MRPTDLEPILETRINDRDEAEAVARWVVEAHAAGMPWRDLLVVAPGKRKWREKIAKAFDAAAVPHRMLLGEPGGIPDSIADPAAAVVHVVSFYGAEGLSFAAVGIVGLGDLPWKQQPLDEALRIVVAAMRVATGRLTLSHCRPSALIDALYSGGYIARK